MNKRLKDILENENKRLKPHFNPNNPFYSKIQDRLDELEDRKLLDNLYKILDLDEITARRLVRKLIGYVCQCGDANYIDVAKYALLNLPREWLVARIEKIAEDILNQDKDFSDIEQLLQLYDDLDDALLIRTANKLKKHKDPSVRETAENKLDNLLKDNKSNEDVFEINERIINKLKEFNDSIDGKSSA